jgi:hypothetical protein
MKNSKQKYDFAHLMNERLSDDKFKSIFKPERVKIASLDSPPNSIMEIVALSEEFEKLQLSKYASVMLKIAEGMDDPTAEQPPLTDLDYEQAEDVENEEMERRRGESFYKPEDYKECPTCKRDHKYDLMNDADFRRAAAEHTKEGVLPEEFIARLKPNKLGDQ